MNIHYYHPDFFTFLLSEKAQEDPLSPGSFLIPAHATAVLPLHAGDKKIAVFDPATEAWSLQGDCRGTYYAPDGSEQVITDISSTPESHWSETQPAPLEPWHVYDAGTGVVTEDLALCIEHQRELIDARWLEELAKGVEINGNRYDCDEQAKNNWTSSVFLTQTAAAEGFAYTPVEWTLYDNQTHTFATVAELVQTGIGVGVHYNLVQAVRSNHKKNIQALTSTAAVIAYDFSLGWPA